MEIVIETIGWLGMGFALTQYILISYKKITGTSLIYQLLNLSACTFLGINLFYYQNWPVFFLQIAWAAVGIIAIIKNSSGKNA